jgi:hypothetical protein
MDMDGDPNDTEQEPKTGVTLPKVKFTINGLEVEANVDPGLFGVPDEYWEDF